MQIDRRRQRRKRLRIRAVEVLHHLLHEQRQRDGGNYQRQHAVFEHRIDNNELEHQAEQQERKGDADQDGEPERRAEIHRLENEKCRHHDKLALGEIDRLRGLPKQREADRHQGVDRPGREAGHHELNKRSHQGSPMRRPPGIAAGRTDFEHDELYLFSFGSTLTIFCLLPTTWPRKLSRSMSPFLSQVASIRMPGSSLGEMVMPCAAWANALLSNLPTFSVTCLTK